jgi:adenylate cyclase
MLIEDAAASGQQFEDLQKINGAGKKLLDLVNDLLDLSKLEAGKMDVFSREFPLADLIDGVVAEWREKVAANGNEFRIDCPDPLGTVLGDETKLRQVVVNLLSNAAKFTSQGVVTLAATNRDGLVTISVRDTGAGIAPDQLVNLFETFGKGDDETSSKYGEDPGLGLPLSQRLCHLLDGELTVETELGRGSCFTLRVPSYLQAKTTSPVEGVAAFAEMQATQGAAHNSILVIDDDPAGLDLLDRILTKEGFSLVLSTNAVDGLMLARQMRPSIIILDIRMPGLNGWQVLQLIRQDADLRASRVVLLTVDDDFNKGHVLGADAHLLKPIDRDALLKCLERFRPVELGNEPLAVAGP